VNVKVKSYYAATVEAAMAQAAREMGQDAVLITSRRTSSDTQNLGAYEVVFGSNAEPSPSGEQLTQPKAARTSAVEINQSELDAMREEMSQMRRAIRAACRHASSQNWMPELGEADAILTDAGIPAELKDDVLEALDFKLREEMSYDQARIGAPGRRPRTRTIDSSTASVSERALTLLREQFEHLLEVAPGIDCKPGNARAVVALAGPSGSGKSTTIVKLAIQYGLGGGRALMVVWTDIYIAVA
jgi:flagellar biosynthesis GTPase FlhF